MSTCANRRIFLIQLAAPSSWKPLACHVRTNHVHIVVAAEAPPEKVMSDFKAYASGRLREHLGEPADCKRWTQHGSTRYLWNETHLPAAIDYTVGGQGEPLAVFDGRKELSEPETLR
jgi:REP element-mobilizing transposase RayT